MDPFEAPAHRHDSGRHPVRRWLDRHSMLLGCLVAAALYLYDLMGLTSLAAVVDDIPPASVVIASAASALMCVLYVVRRRSQVMTSCAVLILAWTVVVLGIGLAVVPLVLQCVMLFVLAREARWRVLAPALLVSAAWMVAASLPLIERGWFRIGEAGALVLVSILAVAAGRLARSRRMRIDALEDRADRLARERDARARIAAAQERTRIAREMHDIVAHSLGTMVVLSDGAARTVGTAPEQAGRAMEQVRDTGREAMAEMRRVLGVLRTEDGERAPQPGLDDLEGLLEATRATGVQVTATSSGTPVGLAPGPDLAAYRIVQEALSNARRHGGAGLSAIRIRLDWTGDGLTLTVRDDGAGAADSSGADADSAPGGDARRTPGGDADGGHGLIGMRERAAAYGGTLRAGPAAQGPGFEVVAHLPSDGPSDAGSSR